MMFECQKCGKCCRNIVINVTHSDIIRWLQEKRWDILDEISYSSNEKIGTGFYIEKTMKREDRQEPCPFLKDNKCSIHDTRPRACADFPHAHKVWEGCPAWKRIGFERNFVKDVEVGNAQKEDFDLTNKNWGLLLHLLFLARARDEKRINLILYEDDPDETLWCNAFDLTSQEWAETGASPFLSDSDANYISSSAKKADHSWFGFANTAHSGDTLNSVYLYVEGSGNGTDQQDITLDDGGAKTEVTYGFIFGAMGYQSVDVSALLDTWTKVDLCKMQIVHENVANACTIRRAYLFVNYTAGATQETKTITADVVLVDRLIETITADIVTVDRLPETITADIVIVDRLTKTVTADIVLVDRETKTITADILTLKTDTVDITADILTLKTDTVVTTADIVVTKIETKAITADIVLVDRLTETITADILTLKTDTKTTTADIVVVDRLEKTVTADIVTKLIPTKAITADIVTVDRLIETITADIVTVDRLTKTVTADIVLVDRLEKTFTADILTQKTDTVDITADILTLKTGTKEFTADIVTLDLIIGYETITADIVLQKTDTKDFTADITTVDRLTETVTADIVTVDRLTKTFTADIVLVDRKTETITADITVVDRYEETITADIVTVDRLIKTITADIVLAGPTQETKTFTADIVLVDLREEEGRRGARLMVRIAKVTYAIRGDLVIKKEDVFNVKANTSHEEGKVSNIVANTSVKKNIQTRMLGNLLIQKEIAKKLYSDTINYTTLPYKVVANTTISRSVKVLIKIILDVGELWKVVFDDEEGNT